MSQYKTHTKFNLLLSLPILLGVVYLFIKPPLRLLTVFAGTFTFGTLYMNPDLDVADKIKLLSFRGIMTLPFRLYAKIFSHRGISHNFLLGTLTRVLWLLIWIAFFVYFYDKSILYKKTILNMYTKYKGDLIFGFAGICCSDWSHLLLDYRK